MNGVMSSIIKANIDKSGMLPIEKKRVCAVTCLSILPKCPVSVAV
jgi:hypothetical protein